MLTTLLQYSASDFTSKFLCHLCGKLHAKDLLLQHMMVCINQCEEPVPYEKTKEMINHLITGNMDGKTGIIPYNNDALDILIRMNVVICTRCDKYTYRSMQQAHCKGCVLSSITDNNIDNTSMRVLYKEEELFIRDSETSRRELLKLRNDILNKVPDKKGKVLKTENPTKKLLKTLSKVANTTPKSPNDTIKGYDARSSLRQVLQSSRFVAPKSIAEVSTTVKRDIETSKSHRKIIPSPLLQNSRAKSFMLEKATNRTHEDIGNNTERLKTDTLTDDKLESVKNLSQHLQSTKRLNDKRLNTLQSKESDGGIVLDQNNLLPIVAQRIKYKSRLDYTASERDITKKFASYGIHSENDRGANLEVRFTDKSERLVRMTTNEDGDIEKIRNISPRLMEIKKRSRIEVPQDSDKELRRNLSLVSNNIKRLEDEKRKSMTAYEEKRSISKNQKIDRETIPETDSEEEMIKIDLIPNKIKKTEKKDTRTKEEVGQITYKGSVRNNQSSNDMLGKSVVDCKYCNKTLLTNILGEHEDVCMKKRILFQLNT